MPHLVNERKALFALCFISLGILVLTQIKLFAAPVLVSEKGLGLLLLAMVLLISGFMLVVLRGDDISIGRYPVLVGDIVIIAHDAMMLEVMF